MNAFAAALWSETLKARRSKVLLATLLIFAFVALMFGLLMLVAEHPSLSGASTVIGTKASRLGKGDWPSYLALLNQAILALGPIGYGIVTSWVFGREFADHTAKDLLALPTRRTHIVLAKFVVIVAWTVVLSALLLGLALAAGWAVQLPSWSASLAWRSTVEFTAGALLTILLCSPIAFIASLSRGYLLPIGIAILLLIITQFVGMGLPGIMPYFPWAIPAICTGVAGSAAPPPQPASYLVLGLTSALGLFATIAWWASADQK